MHTLTKTLATIGTALALTAPAAAKDLGVDEIVANTNLAAYYQGKDGRATVTMTIVDSQNRTRTRKFTILRRDDPDKEGAEQKFFVYFHKPADVAKMVFLVHKHLDRADDRWLYLPSLDLVKRIAATDKRTSFVGSDFFYEDVSGRRPSDDEHTLVETTKSYYVLEHKPKKGESAEFARYVTYIHRGTFLPTKAEYYDASGKKYRVMTVDAVEKIDGKPTVTKATMEDLRAGSKTTIEFKDVEYDIEVPDKIFTERYLRRPPVKYLR